MSLYGNPVERDIVTPAAIGGILVFLLGNNASGRNKIGCAMLAAPVVGALIARGEHKWESAGIALMGGMLAGGLILRSQRNDVQALIQSGRQPVMAGQSTREQFPGSM